jgi:hypothetical protein
MNKLLALLLNIKLAKNKLQAYFSFYPPKSEELNGFIRRTPLQFNLPSLIFVNEAAVWGS